MKIDEIIKTKHTPGPWKHDLPNMPTYITANDESWIATISYKIQEDRGNMAANVKLIAAAPELLEALQEMLAAYLYAYTPAEIEARNTASDAIKKATS